MSNELHIKPAPGCLVRDPRTRAPLAAEGEKKVRSGFWLRRLRDGSVVKVEIAKATDTSPAVETALVTDEQGAEAETVEATTASPVVEPTKPNKKREASDV